MRSWASGPDESGWCGVSQLRDGGEYRKSLSIRRRRDRFPHQPLAKLGMGMLGEAGTDSGEGRDRPRIEGAGTRQGGYRPMGEARVNYASHATTKETTGNLHTGANPGHPRQAWAHPGRGRGQGGSCARRLVIVGKRRPQAVPPVNAPHPATLAGQALAPEKYFRKSDRFPLPGKI